ncbi:MutS-related protein [Achromobacter xylosoxidans]|uniref:MutS-related protein n=1 Tax=Alcaligenes xylosoxydans xylosoxydans TaxID=85698 RepID=UPI001A94934E|nr:DNA mismatch repair protein MutS [Achromobacter xylosoxidans]
MTGKEEKDAVPAGPLPGTVPELSLLFTDVQQSIALMELAPPEPDYFVDLNLDQAIGAILAGREEYTLDGLFREPLHTLEAVTYRHEVFRDLADRKLQSVLRTFAEGMRAMRKQLAQAAKLHYAYQQKRWYLEGIQTYCASVSKLACALRATTIRSRALGVFGEFVNGYVESPNFGALDADTSGLIAELDSISYSIVVDGGTLRVFRYAQEDDYSRVIESTFEKFRQGEARDHRVEFREFPDMNHIEAKVLEFVALLNPRQFQRLDELYAVHQRYLDATVAMFDREIQFYLAYLDHMEQFKRIDRQFCFPEMSESDKRVYVNDSFDIALGQKLLSAGRRVVCNDFELEAGQRMIVVSGPNQGGKTTFARMFGQLFHLAGLGCPVPGSAARLLLSDRVFTHFERQEDINNLRGKLKDDLVRIHQILRKASSRSVLVMNEIFTSTSLADALFLSEKVMKEADSLDVIGVWVTFIDELASYSDKVVSMVSSVDPQQTSTRTFKVLRAPASGRSYAMSLAEKYGLTGDKIRERLQS